MSPSVERCELAPGFSISRVLTGLWQIADMEREGRELDLDAAAGAMAPYVEAGLSAFDMADHYGSAELIAGRFLKLLNGSDVAMRGVPSWLLIVTPTRRADRHECGHGEGGTKSV